MADDSPTLADLFGLSAVKSAEALEKRLGESDAIDRIDAALDHKVPKPLLSAALKSLGEPIAAALNLPLIKIFAGAWSLGKAFKPCLTDPPDTSRVLELNPHKLSSKHQPTIDVFLNDRPLGSLKFEAKVGFEFKRAAVTVRNMHIVRLTPGVTQMFATLSLSGVELLKRTSADWQLPGTLSFGDGVGVTAG